AFDHSFFFFFQAEDGIRDFHVTGVQTCALPILRCGIDRWSASATGNSCGIRWPCAVALPDRRPDAAGPARPGAPGAAGCPRVGEIGRASCRERVKRTVVGSL